MFSPFPLARARPPAGPPARPAGCWHPSRLLASVGRERLAPFELVNQKQRARSAPFAGQKQGRDGRPAACCRADSVWRLREPTPIGRPARRRRAKIYFSTRAHYHRPAGSAMIAMRPLDESARTGAPGGGGGRVSSRRPPARPPANSPARQPASPLSGSGPAHLQADNLDQ